MTSTTSPSEKIQPQLRAVRASDAEALCAIFNMPGFRWGTLRMPFETVDQVERRIAKSGQETTWIVAELDGKVVGHGSLVVQSSPRRSHIGEINIGLDDGFVGKGIGSAILGALLDVADNWRALKRVELSVYVDNEPAIHLYTSHGFEVEGRHVKAGFTDGQYRDLLSMARLRF
ncbi:GNAT family N-acetyltransferase [Mesorhizobium sp. B2-3-13]|uniref:GNAT family N-acetyltransferase n=1 Tax=Mesorhizobium sp. B2-3-13 TaxID=2589951 RepID=UPI00112B2E0B|nr:GNAT family N-acetyltransferase [Mesorhizobium sp. B2-3-13]TPL85239.1 GNAT family N-acetyltransferase [Mesorhizobium sp. B2-3-13]